MLNSCASDVLIRVLVGSSHFLLSPEIPVGGSLSILDLFEIHLNHLVALAKRIILTKGFWISWIELRDR